MNPAILLALVGGRLVTGIRRSIKRSIASLVVAMLALIGFVLVLVALGILLADEVGTVGALLIFAGVFFFLALMAWIIMRSGTSSRGTVLPSLGTVAVGAGAGAVAANATTPPPRRRRGVPAPLLITAAAITGFLFSQYRR